MARTNHDQFAKQYLEELLTPFGSVNPGLEVVGEVRQIDVWFVPSVIAGAAQSQVLGLLSQMASSPCLLEPFRNAPSRTEVRTCLLKLFELHSDFQRKSRRERASGTTSANLKENDLPRLWILSPSASPALLAGFGAREEPDGWSAGVYFLAAALRTALVALNQLPCTPETLWLRILGKGATQQQAISELLELPKGHPLRNNVLELLANWRLTLDQRQTVDEDERTLIMNLSPAYLQWREETLRAGMHSGMQAERRATIENLLRVRFGSVDDTLAAIIPQLLELPPEEFTPLLLNLEREELLNRFGGQTP